MEAKTRGIRDPRFGILRILLTNSFDQRGKKKTFEYQGTLFLKHIPKSYKAMTPMLGMNWVPPLNAQVFKYGGRTGPILSRPLCRLNLSGFKKKTVVSFGADLTCNGETIWGKDSPHQRFRNQKLLQGRGQSLYMTGREGGGEIHGHN